MKTNQEIHAEARELFARGRQFQQEQRIAVAVPRVLTNIPLNPVAPRYERRVEAAIVGGVLIFQLVERDTDVPGAEHSSRDDADVVLASSASAYDVLRSCYQMVEEERLGAVLERYAERSEDRADPADGETISEVEKILEVELLPSADRLRTEAEVVEFLEGRLERGALIARNIARQFSRERQAERHELKLTIGEP